MNQCKNCKEIWMEFFNGDSPSRFGAVLHKSIVANIEQQAVLLALKGMEPNGAMGIVCGISAIGKKTFGYAHWYGSRSSYSCTCDAVGLFAHVAFFCSDAHFWYLSKRVAC